MISPSRKRSSTEKAGPEKQERARIERNNPPALDLTEATDSDVRTPSPTTGTKRKNDDIESHERGGPKLTDDTRAIYDATRDEIDRWYDEQYTLRLGIPKHGKLKHSKEPWYVKLAAWQKHHGLIASPKKKPRPTPILTDTQPHPLRPDKACYPGDKTPVPEYPFASLLDFERMPNGNYACLHTNRNPPLECCRTGLDRAGKRQAIKKSIDVWRKRVERLIDEGRLDRRHMTWPNWYTGRLRAKYQPEYHREMERKRAERARGEREELWRRMRGRGEVGGGVEEEEDEEVMQLDSPSAVFSPNDPAASTTPIGMPQPMVVGHAQPFVPAAQQQGIAEDVAAAQTVFLANLARTNPRQLRAYESLYYDAQFREYQKESPEFPLLRKWYLAYFLREKGQPLDAEQKRVLDSGDPSQSGRKHAGGSAPLGVVNELFGEYLQAARDEREVQRAHQESVKVEEQVIKGSMRARRAHLQGTGQQLLTSAPRAQPLNPADVFEETGATPMACPDEQSTLDMPFDIWDSRIIDRELDRLLATRPMVLARPAARTVAPALQQQTLLRSEVFYVSSLPQSFATGDGIIDSETEKMLQGAYQTDSKPRTSLQEEHILSQTAEESRMDWQRYCDFYATRLLKGFP